MKKIKKVPSNSSLCPKMKTVLFLIFLFAVAHCAEIADEEVNSEDAEDARSCVLVGEDCKNDCQCCGKYTFCECRKEVVSGCSCTFGGSRIYARKKRICKIRKLKGTVPDFFIPSRG